MGDLVLLMGPTGSGKSTQGDLMAEDVRGVHLSSGQLLRNDPTIAALLVDGTLFSAEEVQRVVGEAIAGVDEQVPIILDGLPRTQSDIRWLEEQAPKLNRRVTRVVLLELDIATSLQRLSGRDRADDAPEAIQKKYEQFVEKTQLVVDHYEHLGLLRRVDGRGSMAEVHELVKAALK